MPRNVMALDSNRGASSARSYNRERDFENSLGRGIEENSPKRRESTGNLLADGEYPHSTKRALLDPVIQPVINGRTKRGRFRHESTDTDGSDTSSTLERAPPDGGWGWVVVGAAFLVNLIADGITFSFGVFYVEFTKYFGKSKSATAWIGSLLAAMPLLSGPIASSLTDRFGCRRVTIAGSLLATTGFVLSSFADSIEMLYLTFGIITGFGLSLCYVAAVVIVAYYFERRRSLATGLSVCGGGIGTFVFAPLTQYLIDEYGWRDATLFLSGAFLNLCICGVLMRDLEWTKKMHHHESQHPPSVDIEPVELTMGTKRLCNSAMCIPTFVQEQEKLNSKQKNSQLHSSPSIRSNSATVSPTVNVNNNSATHNTTVSGTSVTSPKLLSRTGTSTNIVPNGNSSQTNTIPTTKSAMRNYVVNNTCVNSGAGLHRHSLTYRGAVLSLKRYRLRPASSCPDIISVATADDRSSHEWKAVIGDVCSWFRGAREWKHLSNSRFLLFTLSNFLLYMWYDVPYMYLQDASLQMGYTDDNSSFLLSIVGLCNTVGNILLGYLGDKAWADLILVYGVCMAVCGGVSVLMPTLMSWNYATLAIGCGIFGLTIAANYSLTSVILVKVVSLERFTNAYGLLLLIQGLGNLIGPVIGGVIYDWTGTSYWSFVVAGCGILMSSIFIFAPKMCGVGSK